VYKNHESPIAKLINLADTKVTDLVDDKMTELIYKKN